MILKKLLSTRPRMAVRVRDTSVIDDGGKLCGQASTIRRIASNAIHTVDILNERRVDAAIAGTATASIQTEQTIVGDAKETGINPSMHGLEDGYVRDPRTGRRCRHCIPVRTMRRMSSYASSYVRVGGRPLACGGNAY